MPKIISIGTSNVPYTYTQEELKGITREIFLRKGYDPGRMLDVFDNSLITTRHFVNPKEWYETPKSFKDRSECYLRNSVMLSMSALENCLERANADLKDFDHIFYVTSSGVSTPSVDALLLNELKLDRHLKRTPIWGLGCAGGAAGLSRAFEYVKAFPESAVLLIASEICSLAYHDDDFSKSNIVSLALFSDGAAAALLAGDEHRLCLASNIELAGSLSTTYYDTLDVMGWEVVNNGFRAIFSKDIPSIVRQSVRENIEELLSRYGLTLPDLKLFAVHPGGAKVISEYETSLGLGQGALTHSRKVLREHGNMSSPTVLYVLRELIDKEGSGGGNYGLISALGPGFSSELILFKTL